MFFNRLTRLSRGIWAISTLCGAIIALSVVTTAHAAGKEQKYVVQAGSYNFELTIGTDALKTATDVPFVVRLAGNNPPNASNQNINLTMLADPAKEVSATPVKLKVERGSDGQSWEGKFAIPISGNWFIRLTADGAAGKGNGAALISVAPPPAIPDQLAWFIGLLPAIFFVAFLLVLARRAHAKRRLEVAGA